MPEHHANPQQGPRTYPASKARQGQIVLKEPWQRAVFIAGLVGMVLLALFIAVYSA